MTMGPAPSIMIFFKSVLLPNLAGGAASRSSWASAEEAEAEAAHLVSFRRGGRRGGGAGHSLERSLGEGRGLILEMGDKSLGE